MTEAHDDQIICGEGYGPGGVAVLVTCREPSAALASAVRAVFGARGGYSGAAGSVAYLFNLVGILEFPAGAPASLRASAFVAGAEDVVLQRDGSVQVITDPLEVQLVRARLTRRGYGSAASKVVQRPAMRTRIDPAQAADLRLLVAALQSIAGVTHVYDNAEVPALLA